MHRTKLLLILLLVFTFFIRIIRIDYPSGYVFDEVYHAFTAREYAKNSKVAWEWWNAPPPGVAYEWTHPPLAKEIMALSLLLFRTEEAWAWRLPGVLFGTLSIYLLYKLALQLFKKESLALTAGFLFSIDGLNFVQSRTGMNDIYFVTFMLFSVLLLNKKKFFLASILLGLALASKWTALYLIIFEILLLIKSKAFRKKIAYFFLVPLIIYLISYLPFFLQGHSFEQFVDLKALVNCQLLKIENPCVTNFGLQNQMLHYHTHLVATHNYSSPWWSWPLNLVPVWYFVDYHPNNIVSNIFGGGNPLLFWMGFGAIVVTLWDYVKDKIRHLSGISSSLFIVLLGYFVFLLPWALSPRIMFLYHYSPSIPFMALALSYQLHTLTLQKGSPKLFFIILGIIFLSFVLIYPFLTGIPISRDLIDLFFTFNTAKNPFK